MDLTKASHQVITLDSDEDGPTLFGPPAFLAVGPPWDRLPFLHLAFALADLSAMALIVLVANTMVLGTAWPNAMADNTGGLRLLAVAVIASTPAFVHHAGLYRMSANWRPRSAQRLVLVTVVGIFVAARGLVALGGVEVAPTGWLLWVVVPFPFWLLASRLVVHRTLVARRVAGKGVSRVLLIGTGPVADGFVDAVQQAPEWGLEVIGFLNDDPLAVSSIPHLGSPAMLCHVLANEVIDEVVICLDKADWAAIARWIRMAEEQGKRVRTPLQFADGVGAPGRDDWNGTMGTLSLDRTARDRVQGMAKRVLDVVGATLGLLVFTPALVMSAAAIKLTDGGPVLFRQTRVGLHGRKFQLWKLRTMVVDAEERLAEVAHLNERDGVLFKVTRDPRVTPIGRVLRATSLDEIPQFWNVIRGEMSLVGPRPALPREVRLYQPRHRRRLAVRPGVTGLWQVSGRTEESFEAGISLDLEYVDGWSPRRDVDLILRTLPAMWRRTGA